MDYTGKSDLIYLKTLTGLWFQDIILISNDLICKYCKGDIYDDFRASSYHTGF